MGPCIIFQDLQQKPWKSSQTPWLSLQQQGLWLVGLSSHPSSPTCEVGDTRRVSELPESSVSLSGSWEEPPPI